MAKPKLLTVITEDWYFVAHRLKIAALAKDAGFDVAVATNVAKHGQPIRDAGFALHPIPFKRSSLSPVIAAREVDYLRELYAAERPDIVHHIALKPIIVGGRAARGLPIKGIVNGIAGLGRVFASETPGGKALRWAVGKALSGPLKAPRTVTTTENDDDRNDLIRADVVRPSNIQVVHGAGVDLALFDLPPPPPGPPLVILPARLLRLKGVAEFVEAARLLKQSGTPARFALVGAPDPSNANSISEVELDAWRRQGDVEVWGYRTDMPHVLAQATIVCLPTYYREGLPMALIEAAAAGRVIVTTDVPGSRQVARGGAAGWVVPPRNVGALAEALSDAIRHPEKRERLTSMAKADAVAFYDVNRVAAQTLAIFDALLGR